MESKGGSGAPVKAGTREKGGLGLGKGAEVAPLGMGGVGWARGVRRICTWGLGPGRERRDRGELRGGPGGCFREPST